MFCFPGAAAMGDALKTNNTLLELDLSHNRITEKGALAIAKGLEKNKTLRVLKMGFNPIERSGSFALIKALKANIDSEMEELHLNNVRVGKDFKDVAEEFLGHTRLTISLNSAPVDQGTVEANSRNKRVKDDLLQIVKNFLIEKRLRAIDLFNRLDRDKSHAISGEEMFKGLKAVKVPLSDFQINKLILLLDKDGNGEVDYAEFSVVNY